MKQSLQLKAVQQLVLTPQLQQSIKLLQMSTVDLQAEVERFLLENPMLERDDACVTQNTTQPEIRVDTSANASCDNGSSESERFTWDTTLDNHEDEFDVLANVPITITLRNHLLSQLSEISLSSRDHALVHLLIEELDDAGYLPLSLDEVLTSLPHELHITQDELSVALTLLQQFDPPGVAARSLAEALSLQLMRLPSHTPGRAIALTLVKEHLARLGNREYDQLRKILGINETTFKTVQQLISGLNPRPSSNFGMDTARYIIPDVMINKKKYRWVAELNDAAVPKLRVHPFYTQFLTQNGQDIDKLAPQLQEARWLIKNIKQRFDTILKVSQAIVERQQAFFEKGEIAMQPLILRDIAEELDLHESTVSRVATQKFLYCSRGLFELKYFFSTALGSSEGNEHSAVAIKAHIRKLIDTETSSCPLSDNAITIALGKLGIQVARRTIAKYREAMRIPPAHQRKIM